MLVLLEKQGLIQRKTHPTDARARTVALTPQGEKLFQKLWQAGEPIRKQIQNSLPPGTIQDLVRLLQCVATGLNTDLHTDLETVS